uniref:Uncharacterized protein n=1 Tax=Arundo donax TaxID=35708 RepID=A0A0A9DZ94_ARUDO
MYAVGGRRVMTVRESMTEPAAKTMGGTLSVCPATAMAWRRTRYSDGACGIPIIGVSTYLEDDTLGTPRMKNPCWLAVRGRQ